MSNNEKEGKSSIFLTDGSKIHPKPKISSMDSEKSSISTNDRFKDAIKNAILFQTFFNKFIEKLVNDYSDYFAQNMQEILDELKIFVNDDLTKYVNKQQLKKSPMFTYVIRYLHHITASNAVEGIEKLDIMVLENIELTIELFGNIPIKFYNILKSNVMTDEYRLVILQNMKLLYKCALKASEIFELSEREKRKQKAQKIYVNHMREKMRAYIYETLGEEGNNPSMKIIIEEILDELEKKRKAIESGQMKPNQIKDLINKLYIKLEKKHKEGKIDEQEMFASSKIIIKNLLNHKDLNLKDGFKDILASMNFSNVGEENMKNMMDDLSKMDADTTSDDFENIVKKYASKGRGEASLPAKSSILHAGPSGGKGKAFSGKSSIFLPLLPTANEDDIINQEASIKMMKENKENASVFRKSSISQKMEAAFGDLNEKINEMNKGRKKKYKKM